MVGRGFIFQSIQLSLAETYNIIRVSNMKILIFLLLPIVICAQQMSKHELDGDLNDKQNFDDEKLEDLSSDKSGENE